MRELQGNYSGSVKFTARGVVPPVFTPFHANDEINYEAIPPYLEFLVKENIKTILVGGTTGEAMSLNVAERKKVTEAWVNAAQPHGVHVMVQVGGAPMPDVIELAKHAQSVKADSLLTLPELYFRPTTVEELVAYVEQVGKAAPNTPLLYYHIPKSTNVNINMKKFITAATARVPNFKGIKFTCNDLSEGTEALHAASGDQAVFLGADSLFAPALLLGFDSAIGTTFNLLPGLAHALSSAVLNNELKKARDLQNKLNQAIAILTAEGPWVPVMKVGMELLTGVRVGPPRPPQAALSYEQKARIVDNFRSIGLLKDDGSYEK